MNAGARRRYRPVVSHGTGKRCGSSLIEVIVTMAVGSVMLGLAVGAIGLLLRAEGHATEAVWHTTTLSRLSRRVRDDVHAAGDAEIRAGADDQPPGLALTVEDEKTVIYEIDEHELTRLRREGGRLVGRESYYLPPGARIRFENVDEPGTVIRLRVEGPARDESPSQPDASAPRSAAGQLYFEIEAVVGRDRRFESTRRESP